MSTLVVANEDVFGLIDFIGYLTLELVGWFIISMRVEQVILFDGLWPKPKKIKYR